MERETKKGENWVFVLPQVGQMIWLSPASLSEEKSRQVFRSRIADTDGDVVAIELPTGDETGRPGAFVPGSKWMAWYIGSDGARYDFHTEILGRRSENIPLLLIRIPDKQQISRTQRRHFLRVQTSVEIAVKTKDKVRNYHFLAKTLDLSGGGMAFSCPDTYKLMEKDKLTIWIALPSKAGTVGHAVAEAEIIRIMPPKESGQHQWVSVKFTNISETDRAKVIRACYERQLDMRKKGSTE